MSAESLQIVEAEKFCAGSKVKASLVGRMKQLKTLRSLETQSGG